MVQLKGEEEAKKLRIMSNHTDIPEPDEQVVRPDSIENFDSLFNEPDIEEQDDPVQVNELQHDLSAETDWAQIEAAFPQYANAMPNATVEQVDHTVTAVTEVRHTRESSVEPVAVVKQMHEGAGELQEVDQVTLAGGDTIADSVRLQDETRTQIPQPEREQIVEPDVELPRNVTPPASPTISHRGSTLQTILDDDDMTPASPASQPPLEPQHAPVASPKPRMSNAPPNYAPVKTRSRPKRKPTGKEPRRTQAGKSPRKQSLATPSSPLSPNAELSDTDETKLWCICREVDDGEKMVMCAEPHCKAKWFHFGCVGLERSPPKEDDWWCFDHRKTTARQKKIAEESQERAAVKRQGRIERRAEGQKRKRRAGKGKREKREGEKGVAKVVKTKVQDEAADFTDEDEEERPSKKTKKAKTKTEGVKESQRKKEKRESIGIYAGPSGTKKHRQT
ncbi:hypothetical protein E8E11_010703 [Didymella keratinophila]|nr:hypothetical protein E8E11_010703 [Didymella keratinophila]